VKEQSEQLKKKILTLFVDGVPKTATHLTEELRTEHPGFLREITALYNRDYNLGGCGALMSPATLVLQALHELQREGRLCRQLQNGNTLWQRK
jgi:hypothetical protein